MNGTCHLRILIGSALARSVALEVVDQSLAVVAQVTEVNSLTTLAEEKEAIEDAEQLGGRLVNSKNGS